ncbi:hypothetical protein VTO73DRAFT_5931 [Trametes versicolor]
MTRLALTSGDIHLKDTLEATEPCEDDMEEIEGPEMAPPPSSPPPRYKRTGSDGGGESDVHVDETPNEAEDNGAKAPVEDGPGLKAAKAFGMGLGAIVAVPFAVAGVGVLAVGATVWGAAKVLQGVGGGLAAGPEAAARAAAGRWRAGGEHEGQQKENKNLRPREGTDKK